MRNRLLLIIINSNKKLAEHRILSSNELKTNDLTMLLTDPSIVIREEYNYSDANNIPYSDQEMTIKIEHD